MRRIVLPVLIAARSFLLAFVGAISTYMLVDQRLEWPGGPAWFLASAVGMVAALNSLQALYMQPPPKPPDARPLL